MALRRGRLAARTAPAAAVLAVLAAARAAAQQEILPASPAEAPPESRFGVHFQLTTVTQAHPSFDAPYSGQNSLRPDHEHETTVTSTLFLGARLWKGAELYADPELAGGSGLSKTLGIAGFPNGEAFRVGDPEPRISLARVFLRQAFAAGPETESVADDANQLGGRRPVKRWTVTLGKFSVTDIFDDNAYSHDPRTQFLNWAVWTAGAWDYSADTRGYTWGGAVEYEDDCWAARFAATAQPKVANGLEFDKDLSEAYALSGEYERRYTLGGRRGIARAILFYNRADMGSYREAIDTAPPGTSPDVTLTRRPGRSKWGFAVNLEQATGETTGLFLRVSWNDGANEAWAYAEIERSVTLGAACARPFPGRPEDAAGFAIVINGLSHDHRDYLAAGGYGFMIGDGKLGYGFETIGEVYYRFALHRFVWLTADYQFVQNPAYNEDRGPVHVFGLRLHTEF